MIGCLECETDLTCLECDSSFTYDASSETCVCPSNKYIDEKAGICRSILFLSIINY